MGEINAEKEFDPDRFVPIPVSTVRVETVTKFDLYLRSQVDDKFVLYASQGLPFTKEAQKGLQESRVESLYIDSGQEDQYREYLVEHISDLLDDPGVPVAYKTEALYTASRKLIREVFSNPTSAESRKQSRLLAVQTVDILGRERTALEHLIRTASLDYEVYSHCVNVCVYGVALALRFGMADDRGLRDFASGAILLDIGKSQIDPAILKHDGELTLDQWESLKQHTVLGRGLLEKAGGAGVLALDVVTHHHELLNGRGYPHGLKGKDISQWVRIATIADVFDALTTHRPFQKAVSSYEALRIMNEEMRDALDPDIFKVFVEMMGKPTD